MCEVDWAAAGTWAAVVVALGFGWWDKLDRRGREAAEAKVIALLLGTELSVLTVRTRLLVEELAQGGGGSGLYDQIAATEEHVRDRIAQHVDGLSTSTLEAVIGRLHVLPQRVSRSLLTLLTSVRELRLAGNSLRRMSKDEALDDVPKFLPHLRVMAQRAHDNAISAEHACQAVSAG